MLAGIIVIQMAIIKDNFIERRLNMEKHECEEISIDWPRVDEAEGIFMYGPILHSIVKEDGKWIAHNGEFASYIAFCPFCGKKLD